MLIHEIILENFMSYEYARIKLSSGVNLICGPNGAGKSSILLGISVALGQSYTERSKRLSDLIRRGKDIGRVTLVLDNSEGKKSRPIKRIRKDRIYLTRVLRKDGKYWFELNNTSATRGEVVRLLSHFGINPDNMLIIMHQDMAEQFVLLSPQEKLKLVEAAAGLEPYRNNVNDARKKLSYFLSQEESLEKMLKTSEQTLSYWREQYDRYQIKKQLVIKRKFLARELLWSEVAKREEEVLTNKKIYNNKKKFTEKLNNSIYTLNEKIEKLETKSNNSDNDWIDTYENQILVEKEKTEHETTIALSDKFIETLDQGFTKWETIVKNSTKDNDNKVYQTRKSPLKKEKEPILLKDINIWFKSASNLIKFLNKSSESSQYKIHLLDRKLEDLKSQRQKKRSVLENLNKKILKNRIGLEIFRFKKKELTKEIELLEKKLSLSEEHLQTEIMKAKESGARIVALRSSEEILDEIRVLDGRISAMDDISNEIEQMYESYSKLFFELKEKTRIAMENRKKALEEIKTRLDAWKKVVKNLLEHIVLNYQKILLHATAKGSIRLINENDFEQVGIEISVGFKGSQIVPLSIYSQSGGERSTAIMAFLLALQQRVRSPFRAIDEYDVHMDPKNREVVASLLISAVEGRDTQYLAITPNQMLFQGKDVHVVTAQNVEGNSMIREVK
jgi:chromosome segregation ATPase